jgi:hypothetical protein
MTPATITAQLIEHADGRPVAYVDATAVAVFAYQRPDGTYVIDVYTRNDTASARLRLDGQPLTALAPAAGGEPGHSQDPHAETTGSG